MLGVSIISRGAELNDEIAQPEPFHGVIITLGLIVVGICNAILRDDEVLAIVFLDKIVLIVKIELE